VLAESQSPGFIWWKEVPANIPTAVTILNQGLSQYGVPSVKSAGDLFLGDLTLVVGIPELDPLPDTGSATYIGPLLWQKPNVVAPEWFTEKSPVSVLWPIVTVGRQFAAILAPRSPLSLCACLCRLQLHVELQAERCRYLLDGAKSWITVGMLQLRNGLLTYTSALRNVSLRQALISTRPAELQHHG
jgi:hypothetical protein